MSFTSGRLNVSASAARVAEGSGDAFVDVALELSQGLATATTYRWVIQPGGASYYDPSVARTALPDVAVTEGSITFAAGETRKVVRVGIVGDAVAEQNEAFTFILPDAYLNAMNLGSSYNYPFYGSAPASAYSAGFTVINDDAPAMRLAGASVIEGGAGANTALPFTVSLDAPMNVPVTVQWRTLDGTATAGTDYAQGSGTLTLAPGETIATIPVAVLADAAVEGDETLRLELSAPVGATLAGGAATLSAIGTIRTDDAPPLAGTQRLNPGVAGAWGDAAAQGFAVSAGATRLAFVSTAGNLVLGDSNGRADLFTRDLAAGGLAVRSVVAGEALGDGWTASLPGSATAAPSFALSADGARLAYGGTRGGAYDLFVEDLATGVVRRVGADGVAADAVPALSADGTLVAFSSAAGGLVAGDDAASPDLFVRDPGAGTTARVGRDASGAAVGGGYRDMVFSADGTKLAFTATAPGGGPAQVWVQDLGTGALTLVSGTAGLAGDGDSGLPVFSPDGTRLAFSSAAANLSPLTAVTPGLATQVWVRDLGTGALGLASSDANGSPATAAAPAAPSGLGRASFSADGTLLAFSSDGRLVGGDVDGRADVYVRGLATGTLLLEGGNGAAVAPVFLPDNSVAFLGAGSDLVAGDNNGATDIFRTALPVVPAAGPSFSVGDMQTAEFIDIGISGGVIRNDYASFTIAFNGVTSLAVPPASVRWSIGALSGARASADGRYGLAEAGTDFTAASGTVYFGSNNFLTQRNEGSDPYAFRVDYRPGTNYLPAAGDGYLNAYYTTATIRVAIPNDTVAEADELFAITLSDATGATILDRQGIGIIRNDDAPRMTIVAGGADEGAGGALPFTVRLAVPTTQTVTVNWRTADGTALAGSDYAAASGALTFAPGETSKTIAVAVSDDALAEAAETLRVELSSPAGATFGDGTGAAPETLAAAGTIRDDDSNLSVSASVLGVAEGGAGTRPVTFTVTRSGDLSAAQGATWTVAGAGANPADAADFAGGVLPSGTVTFAAGQASATITVAVAGDAVVEADEGFGVVLSAPTGGATLGLTSAGGVIRNDDSSLSVAALAADRAEGSISGTRPITGAQTDFTFEVTRGGDLSAAQGATWTVAGAGAGPADAADFVGGALPSGTVAFAPGEATATIVVSVGGDEVLERDEGFVLALSAPTGGAALGTATAAGVIRNDDTARVRLSDNVAPPVAEGGPGAGGSLLFQAQLLRAAALPVTVGWRTVDGTALAGSDYVAASGTLTFAPGETGKTIAVAVLGDALAEADESLGVELFNPGPGADLGIASASGIIRNDDAAPPVVAPPVVTAPAAALSVAALAADRAEGSAGATPFTFTVTRSGDLSAAQGATWTVAGSGANPADAADFAGGVPPSGTVAFATGEARRTITVAVAGDAVVEADEGFVLTLSGPTGGATLGVASAAGVIVGDDAVLTPVVTAPLRVQRSVAGTAGVDVAAIDGGLRGSAVLTEGGLPSRVTVGESGPGYALRGVEVLDFADGRLVFDPADPAAQVARLFNAALARGPDQAGLNYYVAFLEGGRSLADIGAGFINSPEFAARYGAGLSDDAYVGRLYGNVLGRGASGEELGYYRAQFAAGATREQVLTNFSESPENKGLTAGLVADGLWDLSESAATTARLYDTMFGRLPDIAGLRYYRDLLDGGALTPLGFVGNFIGSPEFRALYGAEPGNARIVDLLYRNTLNRAASGEEIAYYVSQLDAGTLGREQMVLNFSESPEHVTLTAPNIASDVPGQYGIAFA